MVKAMKFWGLMTAIVLLPGCSSALQQASEPRGEVRETPVSEDTDADQEVGEDSQHLAEELSECPSSECDPAGEESAIEEPEDDTAELLDEGPEDEELLDDGGEDDVDVDSVTWQELPPHPLEGLTTKQLLARMRNDMASLGPMSLGRIHGGALINGVQMPEGEDWIIRQPNAAWGTQETVDAIGHCISKVRREIEGTPRLYVGHLSRKSGGRFPPHVSHQNGRDVDLGYYYHGSEAWYVPGSQENFDTRRNWALVKCFVTETDVELILSASRLIRAMRDYAIEHGEDPHWVHQIMGGETATLRPIVRHASGHGTHFHVRFFSPLARETGRIMYGILLQSKVISPPRTFVNHRAKRGHTLAYMARRYRTSQHAIRRANRMRGNLVREGKIYRIPRSTGVAKVDQPEPIRVPNRRLPPRQRADSENGSSSSKTSGAQF
jgi:murein endopeptidase